MHWSNCSLPLSHRNTIAHTASWNGMYRRTNEGLNLLATDICHRHISECFLSFHTSDVSIKIQLEKIHLYILHIIRITYHTQYQIGKRKWNMTKCVVYFQLYIDWLCMVITQKWMENWHLATADFKCQIWENCGQGMVYGNTDLGQHLFR